MKECPYCNFENFTDRHFCANCHYPIEMILQENFNIATFLKKNYQLYAIFGILLALFEYILKEHPKQEIVGLFPLIIAVYLILFLLHKSLKIMRSRIWDTSEEFLRHECSFQFVLFYLIHFSLIITLLVILPETQRNIMGFLLGAFIFIIYFASNFSNNQIRKELLILLSSVLFYEIALFLFLIIPFLDKIPGNGIIATYYGWFVSILLYFGTGGIIAFAIIIFGYNMFSLQHFDFSYSTMDSLLSRERENGKILLDWLLTLDIFIGSQLVIILLCITDFYRGM